MIVTHRIEKMDLLAAPGVAPRIQAVQDDRYSRNVELDLWAGGKPWPVPAGTAGMICYQKSDGTGGNYDTLPDGAAAYSISGNTVTVALAPQVLTSPGRVQLAVALVKGETRLHTFAIEILVERNPGLVTHSENYYRIAGAVADSGWAPNKYLGTDEEGNVVAKEAPAGGGTGELLQATALDVVKRAGAITVTTTLEDGSKSVSEITLDENEYPTKITTDGVECPVTWEGFTDVELTDVSEVGA